MLLDLEQIAEAVCHVDKSILGFKLINKMVGEDTYPIQCTEKCSRHAARGVAVERGTHDFVETIHRLGTPQEEHVGKRQAVINIAAAIFHLGNASFWGPSA